MANKLFTYIIIDDSNKVSSSFSDKKKALEYIEQNEMEDTVVLTVVEAELAVLPEPVAKLEKMTTKQLLDMFE